jgi:hypothetical protein
MEHKNDCVVCGKELVYPEETQRVECFFCGETHEANALCAAGHFVCDKCHSLKGNDLIEQYCTKTELKDPMEMARALMKNPHIKMHGPEHHFLVPAVILKAYYRAGGVDGEAGEKIRKARHRAENVLGGFCGFYGDCGAAVGTGISVSLITDSTPLSTLGWRQSNLMTAKSLFTIAIHGGPRCCKRNSFLAIAEAVDFIRENFGVDIPLNRSLKCGFTSLNKECLKAECPYFDG